MSIDSNDGSTREDADFEFQTKYINVRNYLIHIIDNLFTGYEILLPKKANFTCCGIEDSERIAGILNKNKFDALMHFAGYIQVEESVNFPEKYFINNNEVLS